MLWTSPEAQERYAGRQPPPTVLRTRPIGVASPDKRESEPNRAGPQDKPPRTSHTQRPFTRCALRDHEPQRAPKHNNTLNTKGTPVGVTIPPLVLVHMQCHSRPVSPPRGSSRRSLRAARLVRLPAARAASRVKGPTFPCEVEGPIGQLMPPVGVPAAARCRA